MPRPMLATPTAVVPKGGGWAWELKWDGVRAVATVEGANAIIALRCCHMNNRFEDYWDQRQAA